jgi:hypothetical protein
MMARRFGWRNPTRRWRVLLVAGVLAVPGGLSGAMVSLFLGWPVACTVVGTLLGATLGGLMEATDPDGVTSADEDNEPRQRE